VDRVTLSTPPKLVDDTTGPASPNPAQSIVVESSSRSATLAVPACPNGCWVIHGEGYNDAWTATVDGRDLGPPRLIDGNANGWWLDPTESTTTLEIRWPVQRQLNVAFLLSALAVVGCLALTLWRWRLLDTSEAIEVDTDPDAVEPADRTWVLAVVSVFASALLIDWVWAIPIAAVWAAAILLRRTWIVAWVGVAVIAAPAMIVTSIVRSESPFPDAGWPARFEGLHPWTLLGVALLVSGSLAGRSRLSEQRV
jgi:arabinofuranan 3-O-arabinosyltransferase